MAALAGVRTTGLSGIYRTEPQGVKDQPWFYNQVVRLEISADWTPEALLAALKAMERDMGRVPGVRFGPRIIDADVLLFGEELRNGEDLTLPHPRMTNRAFVLVPLRELCPDCTVAPGISVTAALQRLRYRQEGDVVFQED